MQAAMRWQIKINARHVFCSDTCMKKIRYAVVGLGHIAQVAVLPAFQHARKNSELTALVSGDSLKLKKLGEKYRVKNCYSYDEYEACLESGQIDAVYIALPNSMHCEYAVRAANRGIHVLCEKPMAVTAGECQAMIEAASDNQIKLMIAYRLHFEECNLRAVQALKSGKIGDPRIFNSVFTMQVRDENNIRLHEKMGGGTLYDIGIYCINAARYLFQSDPYEVSAYSVGNTEPRFTEVDEMSAALMHFPEDRLASFTSSFGAADNGILQVVGTEGVLTLNPAYEYAEGIRERMTVGEKKYSRKFAKSDQFAPELLYFSECVLKDREPEPSGQEGMIDVQIITALYRSAQLGKSVQLPQFPVKDQRPDIRQMIHRPPVRKPQPIHAASASG